MAKRDLARRFAPYDNAVTPEPGSEAALSHAQAICALLFGAPGTRRFHVRYWNGLTEPARSAAPFTFVVARPGGLRRMLLPPNELTIIEAALSGDVEIEGDMESAMWLGDGINQRLTSPRTIVSLVRHLRALPREDAAYAVREHRARHSVERVGAPHEPERDRAAIRYHYDVGNHFYALWLDRQMLYSCAYFAKADHPDADLDSAQTAKLDIICRKLRLAPSDRLLDVGCGWGALIMHAARHYGVTAVASR